MIKKQRNCHKLKIKQVIRKTQLKLKIISQIRKIKSQFMSPLIKLGKKEIRSLIKIKPQKQTLWCTIHLTRLENEIFMVKILTVNVRGKNQSNHHLLLSAGKLTQKSVCCLSNSLSWKLLASMTNQCNTTQVSHNWP